MLILHATKHDPWMQALGSRIVLTDSNQLLVHITHLYVLSVGPLSFRHSHLSSVIGPPHVLAA